MKYIFSIASIIFLCSFLNPAKQRAITNSDNTVVDTIPVALPASFTDDYGIRYTISNTLWLQHPSAKYHVVRWNTEQQYLIARNDTANRSDKGLFTRIDYMKFTGMAPYTWGFCLTTYDAVSDSLAEFGPNKLDRLNPRKGCNGYPFSRMKPAQ